MTAIVDLDAELSKLVMLEGRTPTTSEAERRPAIARLAPYRDGAIFAAKFAGKGAWERHPQGDEIVHVVEGRTTLRLITAAGRQSLELKAGMMIVVPRNAWHQFEAPEGVTLMTTTPLPTEHIETDIDERPSPG